MTYKLVENINKLISKNDVLYFLGDWSFGGFDKISLFRNMLNVEKIHLILGNHDTHIMRNKGNSKSLFESINNELVINHRGVDLLLTHYPKINLSTTSHRSGDVPNESLTKMVNLFGHIHSSVKVPKMGMDVGVDGNPEFRPYEIDEVFELIDLV